MQHPLISSFVCVRFSTCFDYCYNPSRFKRLRRNNGVYSCSFPFICLFVFYESKLSCFEVSCTFLLWALIEECWHNWSIIPVIYRGIFAFVEKHHSRPGIWIRMWQSIQEVTGGTWTRLSCRSLCRWYLLWYKDYVLICAYISFSMLVLVPVWTCRCYWNANLKKK